LEIAINPSESLPTTDVCGIRLVQMQLPEAVAAVLGRSLIHTGSGNSVRFVNAWSVVLASRDDRYLHTLNGPGWNFADGAPVARILQRRSAVERVHVRGPAFFEQALDTGRALGVRHYLFGTDDETLTRLCEAIDDKYPGCEVVGTFAPPHATAEQLVSDAIVAGIRDSAPDIVWVALGTPKQDLVGDALATQIDATFACVGAAFDFLSGAKRTAPRWVQVLQLEWLYRLLSEPRRLWRRYLFGNSKFLWLALLDSFRARRSTTSKAARRG